MSDKNKKRFITNCYSGTILDIPGPSVIIIKGIKQVSRSDIQVELVIQVDENTMIKKKKIEPEDLY